MALLNKEISNENERELGPLKYLAKTTGWPMDKVVNYFLLLIIFVFDPLAIALVVAANMAFAQIRKPKEIVMSTPEGMEFNKPYSMEPPIGVREEDIDTKQKSYSPEEITEPEVVDEDYFSDLEGYIKYIREEDIENLTYPQFIEKHYPKPETEINTYGDDDWATPDTHKEEEKMNILTSTEDLSEEELNDISREVAKTETIDSVKPINPTSEDLENLANALNITYEEDNIPLDRLTDTTQTLVVKIDKEKDKETKSEETTLKYKGR